MGPKPKHMLWSLNIVHFQFTLVSQGPIYYMIGFLLLPMVWPVDNVQRPLDFQGHCSWSMCKVAFASLGALELSLFRETVIPSFTTL